jgi:hypothetical protein
MRSETPHVNFLESHASSSIRVEAQPDTLQSARQFFETCRYLGGEDIQKVSDALYFAHVAHRYFSIDPKKATRKDGKSEYTTHLIAVAQILSEEKCDAVTLQSALLHDVLENTKVTEEYLGRTFGKEVLQTVKTVTKVEGSKADTELKILDGLKDDPRGILIKLADRLHNLRTISFLKENKQKEIALQTYEIYAPLARELGLHAWADELYDRSVEILWEDEYKLLSLKREKEYRKAYEAFSPFEEFLAKKYPDKMILSVSQPAIYSLIDFDESEKSQNTKILTPVEIITTDEEKEKLITFFKTFCAENDIVYDPQGNAEIKLNIGTASFLIRILDQQTASQYYASLLDLYREPSEN